MSDVVGLALPFFGLILLGFGAARIWRRDESALAWLNIYVMYFALPAMFFRLVSATPIEDLANWRFVFLTTLATYIAFALSFAFAALRAGDLREAVIQGLVGGYGNVGYMGAPLAIVAFGHEAAVPAALIFCFDVTLAFSLAPLLMALVGTEDEPIGRTLLRIPRRVLLHPFILATLLGVAAAAAEFTPPEPVDRIVATLSGSAAPSALFALGVTVAQRRLERVPLELPLLIGMKLVVHPVIVFLLLAWVGGFERIWIETAILMASLPPAATIYVLAVQYRVYVLRGSSAIMIGTAVSVVTVTLALYLISTERIPYGIFSGG